MKNEKEIVAALTLDVMRGRLRIPRTTLRALGSPLYVQFLINPENGFIAVLGCDKPMWGGTTNKVSVDDGKHAYMAEFHSTNLVNRIFNLFGALDNGYSYRITGQIDTINRVAYYTMESLRRIERRL